MYDMDSPETLGKEGYVEFMDYQYPSDPVNIATKIPKTTTAYRPAVSGDSRRENDADIDLSEVERNQI